MRGRRPLSRGIEYPIWSAMPGEQCSPGKGPCATSPMPPAITSRGSPSPSSGRACLSQRSPAVAMLAWAVIAGSDQRSRAQT